MDTSPTSPTSPIPPEKKSIDLSHISGSVNDAAATLQSTTPAAGVVPKPSLSSQQATAEPLTNIALGTQTSSLYDTVIHVLTMVGGALFVAGLLMVIIVVNFNAFKGVFGFDPAMAGGVIRTLVHVVWGGFTLVMLGMLLVTVMQFFMGKQQQMEKSQPLLLRLIVAPILLVIGAVLWYTLPQFVYISGGENTSETPVVSKYTSPQMIALEKDEDQGTLKRLSSTKSLTGPITLQFDTSTYIPTETQFYKILNYEWDMNGDGNFDEDEGREAVAMYTFKEKKQYQVTLRIRKELLQPQDGKKAGDIVEEQYGPGDSAGGMTVLLTKIKPTIKLVTTPSTLKGNAPYKIEVDATGSVGEGKLTGFSWDFDGDGKEDAQGVKQSYTYEKNGFYRATLSIKDESGLMTTKTFEVDVAKTSEPQAVVTLSTFQGQAPLTIQFDGTKSTVPEGRIINYKWNFGDDSPEETGEKISHDYTVPGKYKVKLVIETDLKKTAEALEDITVTAAKSAPVARITGEVGGQTIEDKGQIAGKVPLTVKFDSSFSTDPENDIVRREWDFQGDKKYDESGTAATYTYTAPGKYLVTLRLTDSAKNVSETVVNVEVKADDLIAVISADPITGESPLWVAFDGSSSNYTKGQIVSYTWDFGDGTPAQVTGATISHQYQTPGTYTATLTIQTGDGKSMVTKQVISVLQDALVPAFQILPSFGPAPLDVELDARASKGQIVSYRWDFGDGIAGTGVRTTHTYKDPGTYMITLRVQDIFGNAQKTSKKIIVTQ